MDPQLKLILDEIKAVRGSVMDLQVALTTRFDDMEASIGAFASEFSTDGEFTSSDAPNPSAAGAQAVLLLQTDEGETPDAHLGTDVVLNLRDPPTRPPSSQTPAVGYLLDSLMAKLPTSATALVIPAASVEERLPRSADRCSDEIGLISPFPDGIRNPCTEDGGADDPVDPGPKFASQPSFSIGGGAEVTDIFWKLGIHRTEDIAISNCFLYGGALQRCQHGVPPATFLPKLRGGTCSTACTEPPDAALRRAIRIRNNVLLATLEALEEQATKEYFAQTCVLVLMRGLTCSDVFVKVAESCMYMSTNCSTQVLNGSNDYRTNHIAPELEGTQNFTSPASRVSEYKCSTTFCSLVVGCGNCSMGDSPQFCEFYVDKLDVAAELVVPASFCSMGSDLSFICTSATMTTIEKLALVDSLPPTECSMQVHTSKSCLILLLIWPPHVQCELQGDGVQMVVCIIWVPPNESELEFLIFKLLQPWPPPTVPPLRPLPWPSFSNYTTYVQLVVLLPYFRCLSAWCSTSSVHKCLLQLYYGEINQGCWKHQDEVTWMSFTWQWNHGFSLPNLPT